MAAIKQSLIDLQLDYFDLYLIHHPFAWEFKGPYSMFNALHILVLLLVYVSMRLVFCL